MEKEQTYYEFTQNNSGGSLIIDDKLCHRLFVEAVNTTKAIEIVSKMGVYFFHGLFPLPIPINPPFISSCVGQSFCSSFIYIQI